MNPAPNLPRPAAGDGSAGSDGVAPDTLAARNFQHYQILRREDGAVWELGRGTMGITYKALDTNLHSEVALKVVNSTLIDHPNARERFVREARAAAALRHRNVASVYHLGNDGEHFFYAMEFIDGETLDALVRRQGPLPVETALQIALQVARALAAAARQKLVHRDIKPANLMVAHEDADDHLVVKVIDFGLARPTATADGEDNGPGSLTIHGFVGTPQYASPEQLEELPLDARSDIYSLGVTLWFLLTGKPPFGGSLAVVCNQHLSKPPPWETLPATVPEPARKLLAHMLEKDPAQRPQNALDLRREIDGCLADLLRAPVPAPVAGEEDTLVAVAARNPVARLFGGRRIKRNDTVPASVPAASEPPSSPPAITDANRETGTVLGERFALVRLVGEGSTGRVFEARDLADGRHTVAVKMLRSGAEGSSQAERELLREDARQAGAAPHAHLVRQIAFEPAPAAGNNAPSFVAEEWLDGFTWRDLLAARHGALPVAECLHLLGQAASGIDHASSRRLEHLELGLHQIHLHFPPGGTPHGGSTDRRSLLASPMEEWPEWLVKVEPFGLGREFGETGTWAGEVTLLPGAALHPGRASGGGSLAATYLHALARVACELFGGQPPAAGGAGGRSGSAKQVSLPTLSEAGNTVLSRAFADAPDFDSAREFFEALAAAAGFNAATLAPVTSVRASGVVPPVPTPEPEPEPAPVAVEPVPADSSAQTYAYLPSGTPPRPPGTEDTATATTLHGLGVDEWDEEGFSPAFYRDTPAGPAAAQADPWQESRVAQMLEEEEARKLVNPRSTGFVLTVGVILGLLLLMSGFAVVAWRHENQPLATPKRDVRPPAAGDTRRASAVASARSAPPGTPPPLPKARPSATPAAFVQKASPALAFTPAPASAVAFAAANTPPLAADTPSAEPGNALAGGQASQTVIPPEETRQRPDPTPRFSDKTVAVRVNTDPAGAEVFLQGASLGKTPLKLNLPPGDYQFIARYREWPEIRQDLHVADRQTEASADIRLMSPAQIPLGPRFSPVLENRQRRGMRRAPFANDGIPVAPAVPMEGNAPVARARPVVPGSDEPSHYREAAPVYEPPVRRALPALDPFVREGVPVQPNNPERDN